MGGMLKFFAEKKAKDAAPKEAGKAEQKAERITKLFKKHGLSEETLPEIRLTEDEEHNRKVLKLVDNLQTFWKNPENQRYLKTKSLTRSSSTEEDLDTDAPSEQKR